MEFKLTIRLGNEAMQAPADVSRALSHLAERFNNDADTMSPDSGPLRDANGNTVGNWEVCK